MRSPIEMMVDRACGFDPSQANPAPIPKEAPAEAGPILLEIADAAKAWDRNHKKGAARLRKAVAAWKAIGG